MAASSERNSSSVACGARMVAVMRVMPPLLTSWKAGSVVFRGVIVYVTLPSVVVPWDQPREWSCVSMEGMPISWSMGMRTWVMYSTDGEFETFVPPEIVTGIGEGWPEKRM